MTFRRWAAAVAAGLALLTAPAAAQAAPARDVSVAGYYCVTQDNVNYRNGPGTGYDKLGSVMKGQGFVYLSRRMGDKPKDGYWWWKGDLWGGAKGIWIRSDYIKWCS